MYGPITRINQTIESDNNSNKKFAFRIVFVAVSNVNMVANIMADRWAAILL